MIFTGQRNKSGEIITLKIETGKEEVWRQEAVPMILQTKKVIRL